MLLCLNFKFVWLKDGSPLPASNRLRTRYDIGTKQVLLQISDVRPDDVGTYKVIATNPAGQDSTSGKLNVIPDRRGVDSQPFIEPERFLNLKPIPPKEIAEKELKEPKRPPKVIVPLANVDMEEQMPVIFTTTIDAGVPMATVSRFIDYFMNRYPLVLSKRLVHMKTGALYIISICKASSLRTFL